MLKCLKSKEKYLIFDFGSIVWLHHFQGVWKWCKNDVIFFFKFQVLFMLKFYLYVNEELFMEMVKNIFKTEPLGWILSLAAVGLIIAGFVVPPLGIIDGSVLTGTGIIFAFFALDKLPSIINSISEGKQLTISHGNTNVNISSREGEEK